MNQPEPPVKQNKKYEEDHVSEVHEKKPCKDDSGSDSQSEYTEEEQCDDTIEKLRSNSDESDGDAYTLQTPTRVASND